MTRSSPQPRRRSRAAAALPSRKQVRTAIDSGVRTLKDGLLAADGELRRRATAIADRLAGQQPVEVLQALAGELQGRLQHLAEALPTTPAQQRRVREQVVAGIGDLRARARSAVAGRRGPRAAR